MDKLRYLTCNVKLNYKIYYLSSREKSFAFKSKIIFKDYYI